jgi:SAM-dependent methyltransferase
VSSLWDERAVRPEEYTIDVSRNQGFAPAAGVCLYRVTRSGADGIRRATIMTELQRILARNRRRGWRQTAFLVPAKIAALISRHSDRWFDITRGSDTFRVVELAQLRIVGPNKERGIRCQPTRARPLMRLLRRLPLPTEGTFVDIGCGLGRVLMIAAEHGFRRVVGVDFSEELCEGARRNIGRLTRVDERVSIVHADFIDYDIEPDQTVFYCFNPFDAGLVEELIGKLLAAQRDAPRDMWVIYHNPKWRHVFERDPAVSVHSEHRFWDCHFVVYQIAPQAGVTV